MTAATVSENKKKSFFSVRFKSKFSEDMKLFITNLVLQLLCMPVYAGVLLWMIYLDNNHLHNRSECVPFIIIAAIAFILSVGMGFVVPMVNFRYLYNKSLVDMNYSLPLNNRQRFFADFSTGLITYVAPFLVGGIIALAEILIGSCFMEMDRVLEILPDIIKVASIVIVAMIMLYTISVFAMTFAGSTFEALFSIAAVNIMIPLFIYLIWGNIVDAAHFGLTDRSVIRNFAFLSTSPIGILSFIITYIDSFVPMSPVDLLDKSDDILYSFMDSMYLSFIIRTLIVIAVIICITYLLYKHRKAEDVSKPYVYNAFYYLIMSAVIYSIVAVMKRTALENGIIAALIIGGIIWFVMEVIRRRGFKRFWTAVISFAAASAAVIGIIKFIDITNGLGRAKYIPSASSVSSVEIEIWGYDMIRNDCFLHSDKVIADAVELNKEIVDRHFNFEKYDYSISDYRINQSDEDYDISERVSYDIDEQQIRLTYYIKGGSVVMREYTVPSEMLIDLCCDIYIDKEYIENKTKEMYYKSLRYYSENQEDTVFFDNRVADYCLFNSTDKMGVSNSIELSPNEGKELAEALCRDYTAMTRDEFKDSEFYCYIDNIIINSACRETVTFLDKHEIKYKMTSKELIDEIDIYSSPVTVTPAPEYVFPLMYFKDRNYADDYRYYTIYDNNSLSDECIKMDSILSLGLYRGRSYQHYGQKKHFEFIDPEAVEKLLEAASPVVTGEKVLAEVQIGSMTLYITERTGNDVLIKNAKDSIRIVDNATGEMYDPDIYYEEGYSK
ncbi:hypothetical protein [Ruminococcus sp.]|uniref:hypothetical protein n=1 Tax=Ruminococcus sp. TaxID=41978 RepID=UPI0025E16302|nr:hypothetical protein [Ruminococcus sp.]MCR4638097.1 hypothetical protein [Ruminococcus sp.]